MDFEDYHTTHFKVDEIAQSLGVSKSIIRFWEEEFDLPKRTNGTMSRLEAAEIRLIHELIQENSLTLEDAKEAFSIKRKPLEKKFETLERLESLRQGLMALKAKVD
jgi:DNA-binding transcriptional MerR regulator